MATKTNDHTAFFTASKRPDRADDITKAHAAAVYTTWLEAEVQEAIEDTSPTIPHDEAMRRVRATIKLG
jgi:hypothetical protein